MMNISTRMFAVDWWISLFESPVIGGVVGVGAAVGANVGGKALERLADQHITLILTIPCKKEHTCKYCETLQKKQTYL